MNELKLISILSFAYILLGAGKEKGATKDIIERQQDSITHNMQQINQRIYTMMHNEDIKKLRQRRIDSMRREITRMKIQTTNH